MAKIASGIAGRIRTGLQAASLKRKEPTGVGLGV